MKLSILRRIGPGWFVLGAALLWAAGCDSASPGSHEHPPTNAAGSTPSEWSRVAFEAPRRASESVVAQLLGEVALPARARAELGPPIGGQLVAWAVHTGELVETGQPLAMWRSPETAALRAREAEWRGVLRARRNALKQRKAAVAAGAASKTTKLDDTIGVAEAEGQLAAVRVLLDSQQALGVGDPSTGSGSADGSGADSQWTWRSPVRGVVQSVQCAVGGFHQSDETCLTVVDRSMAELRLHVPPADVHRAQSGAVVRWFSEANPESPVDLTWRRCEPEADPRSRTLACYFGLAAATDSAPLQPGAVGRAEWIETAPTGWWAVPRHAVTRMGEHSVVFRRHRPGEHAEEESPGHAAEGGAHGEIGVEPVEVEIRGQSGSDLLVETDGETLRETDAIAVRGVFMLKSHLLLSSGAVEAAGHGHGH